MPQTKTQGAVFGLLMSYFMALGMEVANVAHKLGAMSNAVFLPALKETAFMGAIVFVVSMLYGSRAGQHIAHKFVRQGRALSQVPQLTQESEITYAMIISSLNIL